MLCFGVAKPQYIILLTTRCKCAEKKNRKKISPKLDLNLVHLLVSPVHYPVSCGKVLIGLHILVRLLLTKTKFGRNSNTKAPILKLRKTREGVDTTYKSLETCTGKRSQQTL